MFSSGCISIDDAALEKTRIHLLTVHERRSYKSMSDAQVFIALAIALLPGILAVRLGTELYK